MTVAVTVAVTASVTIRMAVLMGNGLLVLIQDTAVECLVRGRDIIGGVEVAEVVRLQVHLRNLGRHDGEVFHARDVVEAESVPDDNVLVNDVLGVVDPGLDTSASQRLVGVVASGEELAVTVLGNPHGVLGELGAAPVPGAGLGEEHLGANGDNLVSDGGAGHGVQDVGVNNLEDTAVLDTVIDMALTVDGCLLGLIAGTQRVQLLVPGHADRVRVHEAVLVSADGRVNADVEDVLVVGSHDAVGDTGAEGDLSILVDGLRRQNTGGAGLEADLAGLVKDPGEDVLVVGDGDDLLENELALAHDSGVLGAVVGVLPLDALVDLVDADGVGLLPGLAVLGHAVSGQVLDDTKAVAADYENRTVRIEVNRWEDNEGFWDLRAKLLAVIPAPTLPRSKAPLR